MTADGPLWQAWFFPEWALTRSTGPAVLPEQPIELWGFLRKAAQRLGFTPQAADRTWQALWNADIKSVQQLLNEMDQIEICFIKGLGPVGRKLIDAALAERGWTLRESP